MKLGISTSALRDREDLFQIFLLARYLELDVVEIVLRNEMVQYLNNYKKLFEKMSEKFSLLFHPYDIELNKIYLQLNDISPVIDLADQLNVGQLLIHPGFAGIDYNEKMIKTLQSISAGRKKRILVENGYKPGELLKTIKEQIDCIKSIQELGCENVFLAFDVWRDYQVISDGLLVEKHLESLKKTNFLKQVHISDASRFNSISLPLGDGDLNIESIMQILEDFEGYVIIEVDSPEDAIKSRKYLRSVCSL